MNKTNSVFIKKIIYYVILFVGLFYLDRFSKIWALKNLFYENISIFKYLNFSLVLNRGVSFGIFGSFSSAAFYFLTILIFLVICFFVLYSISEYKRGMNIFWHIFIIAGAYSNLLDRIMYKGVVDFIDFYVGTWHWPTFNIADISIVLGVLGILWGMFKDVYFKKN